MQYYEGLYRRVILSSFQAISVEDNKLVSTVTLQATAEILTNGVTCEVSNEYGAESKSFPVAVRKGQCCEATAATALLIPPASSPSVFSSQPFDVRQ